MFDLSPADLTGSALDCCAGGSSFVAELPNAVAVDPAYALGRSSLTHLVRTGLHDGDQMILANQDHFEWGWYGSVERRARMRLSAADLFLSDLHSRPGRYIAATLPFLPRLRSSLPASELRDVPYRFQRGAHQMLVIDARDQM